MFFVKEIRSFEKWKEMQSTRAFCLCHRFLQIFYFTIHTLTVI